MTREQIEVIFKNAQAKAEKDGGLALPEGTNVTLHLAHGGTSLAVAKIESVKFDGELLYATGPKQTVSVVAADVFAIALETATQQRRPAGF